MKKDIQKDRHNALGTDKISELLLRFAPPAMISNLMSALYNMVDQVFIGQGVGYLGNAAVNVAFPIQTFCICIASMTGIGAATLYNLELGSGNKEKKSEKVVGTTFTSMLLIGIGVFVVVCLLRNPLLQLFGATVNNFQYAKAYVRITAYGIPFLLLSTAGNQLIRADGSPMWSMVCVVSGAVLNTILDSIFIFCFHMGIEGAAWATVISQIVSAVIALMYLPKFKAVKLMKQCFFLNLALFQRACILGMTALFNNLSSLLVQIVLNNLLRSYGTNSIYGADIPLAVAGIVSKVNMLYNAFMLGIAQGAQPVLGYNMGLKQYSRVKAMIRLEIKACLISGICLFLAIQLLTGDIIRLFGEGNALYMEFAGRYIHIFFLMTAVNGIQTAITLFCSHTGDAFIGAGLALVRQIVLLIPLMMLFGFLFGINGIVFASPLSDVLAILVSAFTLRWEFKKMDAMAEAGC